jgi:hypothetical protein
LTWILRCADIILVFQNLLNSHATHEDQMQAALDAGGDTDPATDTEEAYAIAGTKRKAGGSSNSGSRCVSKSSHRMSILT